MDTVHVTQRSARLIGHVRQGSTSQPRTVGVYSQKGKKEFNDGSVSHSMTLLAPGERYGIERIKRKGNRKEKRNKEQRAFRQSILNRGWSWFTRVSLPANRPCARRTLRTGWPKVSSASGMVTGNVSACPAPWNVLVAAHVVPRAGTGSHRLAAAWSSFFIKETPRTSARRTRRRYASAGSLLWRKLKFRRVPSSEWLLKRWFILLSWNRKHFR